MAAKKIIVLVLAVVLICAAVFYGYNFVKRPHRQIVADDIESIEISSLGGKITIELPPAKFAEFSEAFNSSEVTTDSLDFVNSAPLVRIEARMKNGDRYVVQTVIPQNSVIMVTDYSKNGRREYYVLREKLQNFIENIKK